MILSAEWMDHPGTHALFDALEAGGHGAHFVGGCVRNGLLDAPVDDIDITTDARPETVVALAEAAGLKAVPTGIDHGTVTIVAKGKPHEVTTLRRDVATDGRRATVAFSTSLEEDAARRDFTMNALYATRAGVVLDPTGQGLDDLRARHLRFIGTPEDRIREDYLRILRFFRFHAWYADPAQGLDPGGLAACAALAEGIETLSRERIGAEMRKLLSAPDPAPATASMAQAGVLMRALPGATATLLPVLVHLEAGLATDPIRRLAALGGEAPDTALRLSKADTRRLAVLRDRMASAMGAAELGYRHGAKVARDILLLRAAQFEHPMDDTALAAARTGAAAVFPIKPADLMPRFTGPALGEALARLEADWIAEGFAPDRDSLLQRLGDPSG